MSDQENGAAAAMPRVIAPHQNLALKSAVSRAGQGNRLSKIRRAERALAELSADFGDWMQTDVNALADARDTLRQSGGITDAGIDALLHAALAIKGQSQMLGYPFSGQICGSLCDLIEKAPDKARIPINLIDHHVDAVRAELRENADMTNKETASALVEKLRSVTKGFLKSERVRASAGPAARRPGSEAGGR